MATELVITDPRFHKPERYGLLDRAALKFIRDERDLPFIWLCITSMLTLVPMAVFLYWPGMFRWWMAPIYWAVNFLGFFDRYILMLHNTSHRPLFKREYKFLGPVIPWLIGPFFGQTPETYFAHHIGMHHAEENLYDDLSSTMRFKRDSIFGFAAYYLRFMVLSLIELSIYFFKKSRANMTRRLLFGEFCFYALCVGLCFVNAPATIVVFITPVLLARFLMMAGNWAQHAFIDPEDPSNPYKSSIVCVNSRYNRRCFNDGYHIGHHEMASRHWTDMPKDFEKKRQKYIDADAVVFQGVDYFLVWAMLMAKQYGLLARCFVDLRDEPRSREEIIELLRSRTAAIPRSDGNPTKV